MGASLQEAFAAIPDFRYASGRRHSLPAILTLAVCAMLSGARSLYAIHQWGRCQDPGAVRAMGFTQAKTPTVSCLHRVFSGLDAAAFETAVARWSQQCLGAQDRQAVAVDGKALRGIHGGELPGVRLVAGYAHGSGLVLGQKGGAQTGGTGGGQGVDGGTAAGAGQPDYRGHLVLPAGILPPDKRGGRRLPGGGEEEPAGVV